MSRYPANPRKLRVNTNLPNRQPSGLFTSDLRRTVLLAITISVAIVLAAGCSSTGTTFSSRMIVPIANENRKTAVEGNDFYEPEHSPDFEDLLGG